MKCDVAHCTRDAVKHRLCVVCCLTWLLTPDGDAGPDRETCRRAFVARQDARHALKSAGSLTSSEATSP